MHLIEIFLPTNDNEGEAFPKEAFDRVRDELTERFGGVTAFLRSPAIGLWADPHGKVRKDEIAIFEVMSKDLDRSWWTSYRDQLAARFRQDEILVRIFNIQTL